MDLGLSGRKAIVCAASKGLGRAVAFALARDTNGHAITTSGVKSLETYPHRH